MEEFGSVWVGDKVGLRYVVFVSVNHGLQVLLGGLAARAVLQVSVSVAASVSLVGGQAGLLLSVAPGSGLFWAALWLGRCSGSQCLWLPQSVW